MLFDRGEGQGGEGNRAQVGAPRTMTSKERAMTQKALGLVGSLGIPGISTIAKAGSALMDAEAARLSGTGFKGFLSNVLGERLSGALGLGGNDPTGGTGAGQNATGAGTDSPRGGQGGGYGF